RKVLVHQSLSILMKFHYHYVVMTLGALAYDPRASYAASTASPEGGQIYHQILSLPVTLMEFVTVGLFEYLFRLNAARMRQTGFSLTERYQIAENMRTLELLRPLARFIVQFFSILNKCT
ncbi:hypothetical protein PMAYCL1PPCAC_10382, partial [Pristionchus mayeri]